MAQFGRGMEVEVRQSEKLFTEEELKNMEGFKRGYDYVEVKCGCTSKKYGDTIALLRVHASGQFQIICDCNACKQDRFTPYAFEKHSRKAGGSRWQSSIWVLLNGKKLALQKTPLLKYYKHIANGASGSIKRIFHRDEFLSCSNCGKERRFRLRSKEDCRIYHNAFVSQTWKCGDNLKSKIRCSNVEERDSRKKSRGCPRLPGCTGCGSCVCFGCLKCRFLDCSCNTCSDFMHNAEP